MLEGLFGEKKRQSEKFKVPTQILIIKAKLCFDFLLNKNN